MTPQEFIATIQKVENTTEHNIFLDTKLKEDPKYLIELFEIIPKDEELFLSNWQLRWIYERIIRVSSFDLHLDYISIANKIFELSFRQKDKNLFASVLCFKQDPIELINKLIISDSTKLLQVVIHELVSRRIDLTKSEYFEKLKLENSKGEFSKLSLFPSNLESENNFPSYTTNGGGHGISFGFQSGEEYENIVLVNSDEIEFTKSDKIKLALDHWGGALFAYRGTFKSKFEVRQIIKSIPELLESKQLRIRKLKPQKAFSLLFDASSNGSAYTTGNYGAYGRMKTWNTINSIISDYDFVSIEQTEKIVHEYEWYEFNTDCWFINEWLDLGIIAINLDKGDFGVIAATDTD